MIPAQPVDSEVMPLPGLLIVFLKAPREGLVKTRLAQVVGPARACEMYVQIVDQVLKQIGACVPVELRFWPDNAATEIERWLAPGWSARPQGEGDLGARLTRALEEAFERGYRRVVVIGSDCPYLLAGDIAKAFSALGEADVVLGPATDGGYWLIGARQPLVELFREIPWSTSRVYEVTAAKAAQLGLRRAELRYLGDIDTLADWERWTASASDVEGQKTCGCGMSSNDNKGGEDTRKS